MVLRPVSFKISKCVSLNFFLEVMKPKGTNLQIFVSNIFCKISKLPLQRTMCFLF